MAASREDLSWELEIPGDRICSYKKDFLSLSSTFEMPSLPRRTSGLTLVKTKLVDEESIFGTCDREELPISAVPSRASSQAKDSLFCMSSR